MTEAPVSIPAGPSAGLLARHPRTVAVWSRLDCALMMRDFYAKLADR